MQPPSKVTGYRGLVWGLLLAAVAANGAAYAFDLFEKVAWIDKVLHASTSFAVTLALAAAILQRAPPPIPRRYSAALLLMLASLGLALGVVWEIAEWFTDELRAGNVIQGKTDTIVDLLMDGFGALTAAFVAARKNGGAEPSRA